MLRESLRRRVNFTVPASIQGRQYRIPVWGGMETPGVSDSWQVELWRRLVPLRPGAFVDAGMNLGQSLLRLRAANENRDFVGFEPNPLCVAYLERLVRENGLEGITVVPTGLSNRAGLVKLHLPPGDSTHEAGTVVAGLRPNSTNHVSRVVSVCVFDEVAGELGASPTAFVKIDVEGHELEALQGMRRTLESDRPIVMVEVLPRIGGTTPEETKARGDGLVELATAGRYSIRRVLPGATGADPVRLEAFDGFLGLPFDRNESYDYLFVPEELVTKVDALFPDRHV